ncbi:hypothetical protein P8452_47802 [Trifolium repens]|nr:hypothetical protein P8452_47802 [Trifolium repens]
MMKSDCGEKAVKDKQTGKTYLLKFKYLYSKSKTQNFPSISHIFSFASTHKFSDCFIFSSLLKNPATGNNREADHTIAARLLFMNLRKKDPLLQWISMLK